MPKFRTGTDDFKKLIDDGGYYVDKSLLIHSVVAGSEVTLLPRPRRFGKTLNMTMLRYFFEKSTEDRSYLFKDLAITRCAEAMAHQGRHPVIYLSLKDIKGANWQEAQARLVSRIGELYLRFAHLGETIAPLYQPAFSRLASGTATDAELKASLRDLILHLNAYHKAPVVVLIDEYDSPIIEAWRKGYYEPMIDFMRAWLGGGLKHEDGSAVYRAVVTGILRVAKESLFSGLNNLDVSSLLKSGPFADKFGFTQPEVDQVLADFDLPELAVPIREWYNGYNFGGHTIYNPWSVIKGIGDWPNPIGPQWLNTASNDLVHAELKAGGLAMKRDLEILLAGGELRYPITEHATFDSLSRHQPESIWSLLLFSGYLSAEDPVRGFDGMSLRYRLAIPNREVAVAYQEFVATWFLELKFNGTDALLLALLEGRIGDFERHLADLVKGLFSVHDTGHYPEVAYHALMLGLLANLRVIYQIRSNAETGYGRADIIMQPKTATYPLAYIIEFKVVEKPEQLDAAVTAALAQIQDKSYASELMKADITADHIRSLAIVIAGKHVKVAGASVPRS